ncbi:SMI1/KNR4 family protein, partial [Pseudomonas aeruginosa]|nr:SMI1/KNR4 family protein [Pseudomonas aeruginosa]
RAVVMALDDHRQALFLVDHGAMTPDCFEPLAPSLEAWLEAGPCLPE